MKDIQLFLNLKMKKYIVKIFKKMNDIKIGDFIINEKSRPLL